MTVYTTSFGSDTAGSPPSGWSARWTTSGSTWTVIADAAFTAGKYLQHTRTTTARRLLSWDTIDADSGRDNCEIFVRWRSDGTGSGQVYLVVRGSGSAGSETAYYLANTGANQFAISKIVSGTATSLGTFNFSITASNFYGLRFRVNGTALKAKVWDCEIDQEPAAWNLEITDASITGTGWAGIGNNASGNTRIYDDVAIATSGDTAAFTTPAAEVRETMMPALALAAGGTPRTTLTVALVMGGTPPAIRDTQFAALVMYQPYAPMRNTQDLALVHAEYEVDIPITQMVGLVLADHQDCVTHWAQCWTITRADGQVFGFTSLDRPLLFRGVVHSPCSSLSATATEQSLTLGQTGNMELLGIVSDAGISERDLINGLFDFAAFEVWSVPWDNQSGETPIRLMAGTTGGVKQGIQGFSFEVLTASANLRQKALLETFTPSCRYGFGSIRDSRCPVDLAAIQVSGSATSTAVPNAANQSSRRVLIDATRVEAAGHFDLGVVTFTSGNNAGASSEIKSFSGGVFVLWSPLLYPIEVGDTYTATPGCNKSPADHMRFNADMVDFGGFPDVPGSDSINQFPDAKG